MRRLVLTALLAALALTAWSCRPRAVASGERSFSLQVTSPRLLRMDEEIALPVVVGNTGTESWNPERVHLSYHWLWLVPREIASRSRNVPYQDGIRTELERAVAPGVSLTTNGRLLAPSWPGLYWLQWDMVEEEVTWFSQVSPRQPRTLVVVIPTATAALAPLPLALALFGVFAVSRIERRRRAVGLLLGFAATADCWWSAAALFAKPFALVSDALLEPTPVGVWLMVATAVAPVALVSLLFSRRTRGWVLFGTVVAGTLIIVADVIYYRFFGDVLSTPALLAVGQTPRVAATIRSLLTARLLWLIVDLPFGAWLIVRVRRAQAPASVPDGRPWRLALASGIVVAAAGAALSAPSVLAGVEFDQMFRNRAVMEQIGPFGFHVYDAWLYTRATTLRPEITSAEFNALVRWFTEREPLRAGASSPYFGVARGKNLIVVQVESLQDFVVDYQVGGQEVMPHLRRWQSDSWRFTNVTDQTNEGRTSDAEFTTMVSLLPLDHGAAAFRYTENSYVGLPRVLAEHGYSTLSAVAFEAGFWNRRVMHPLYGLSRNYFEPDFTMTEQIGWGLNDRDFLQQMVPRLDAARKPFCAWLITLSLHHPFESFPDAHKTLKLGALEGTAFGNYLHTMRFFDQALADFRASLEKSGLLDESVIVVFGDHDAGFPRDAVLSRRMGIGADAVSWELADRVPLFIRVPGEGTLARAIDRPAGQTDMAPTLLGLLGIDAARLPYVGRNLFGQPGDPPIVRPFGDWIDRTHVMVAQGASGHACFAWPAPGLAVDPVECAEANLHARDAHDVSKAVVANDLQQRIGERLAEGVQ